MNVKTPVSALQELMQAQKLQSPRYFEEDYGTNFKCTVFAGGVTGTGIASTKKGAKHESAKNALEQLNRKNVSQVVLITESSIIQRPVENYVGILNEFSSKHGFPYPDYDLIPNSGLLGSKYFMKCQFQNKETIGSGLNKKEAKQDAARIMLDLVKKDELKNYTIVHSKTVIENEDIDKVIALYNTLSCHDQPKQFVVKSENVTASSGIEIDEEDDVELLQAKLVAMGVQYTLRDFQTKPNIIVSLVINGTNFTFMESGKTREEAVKKLLQKVLMVKKNGCSFNTDVTDLISF